MSTERGLSRPMPQQPDRQPQTTYYSNRAAELEQKAGAIMPLDRAARAAAAAPTEQDAWIAAALQELQQQEAATSQEAVTSREPAAEPLAERRQPRRRWHRRRSPYRNGLLLLAGLLCCALVMGLATLIWSAVVYQQAWDVAGATGLPLAIFLGALFVASALVTLLARGGTIYPSLVLCLITCLVSFFAAGVEQVKISGVLLKLALALLVTVLAFTLVKISLLRRRPE